MGTWYIMYNEYIYSLQHLFYFPLLTSGQAAGTELEVVPWWSVSHLKIIC